MTRGVSFLVQEAARAAEAGDEREDEDGRRRAHDHANHHGETDAGNEDDHERRWHKQVEEGQHKDLLLNLCLDDLVLLGAAVLVVVVAAAEDVLALVGAWAVEAVVPLSQGVHITRAILAA